MARKALQIPSAWMMGCTQSRIRDGRAKNEREAIAQCARHWREQDEMQAKYNKQQEAQKAQMEMFK